MSKKFVLTRHSEKDPLLAVTLDIEGYEEERKLSEDLIISDIEKGCYDQPHLYAWWGTISAGAKRRATKAKENFDITVSYLSKNIRKKRRGEKITENSLREEVLDTEEYVQALKDKIDTAYEADVLEVAERAMIHRKDMLVTLAALKRQEMASLINLGEINKKSLDRYAGKLDKIRRKDDDE